MKSQQYGCLNKVWVITILPDILMWTGETSQAPSPEIIDCYRQLMAAKIKEINCYFIQLTQSQIVNHKHTKKAL